MASGATNGPEARKSVYYIQLVTAYNKDHSRIASGMAYPGLCGINGRPGITSSIRGRLITSRQGLGQAQTQKTPDAASTDQFLTAPIVPNCQRLFWVPKEEFGDRRPDATVAVTSPVAMTTAEKGANSGPQWGFRLRMSPI
ncbi:hypothetical protein Bbelb_261480 [Branchiostoma belcheri]|nr:hypothetical protein Bbelb_261480 [Branchiostoma belcheri]